MNNWNGVCNLVRDPESAQYADKPIAKFTVALRQRSEQQPTFIDVESFGPLAEIVMKHLQKGSKIALTGYIKQDRWTSKDGQSRTKLKLIAREVTFLDRIRSQEESEQDQVEDMVEERVPF